MSKPLSWEREGLIWPHRETCDFVTADRLEWRIQRQGEGPSLLLLHGTGASAHSWHRLWPLLCAQFDVLAPDLPGHAFTHGKPHKGLTLAGMVEALAALLEQERFVPDLIVGHSAGAAIAIEWALATSSKAAIVGLNPAIMPFRGPAAQVFPAMAKLLLVNPFAPRIFARMAKVPGEAGRFLQRSTGSRTDAISEACYASLFGNHHHARGALEMMANWDLEALKRQLSKLTNQVLLVHSDGDRAIPAASVEAAARCMANATLKTLACAGHLTHEEKPETVADLIMVFAEEQGVLPVDRMRAAG